MTLTRVFGRILRSLRFSLDTRTKTEIGSLLSSLPVSITSAGRPTRAASSRRQDPIPTAITGFLTSEAPIPTVSHRMSPPLFPRVPPSLVRINQFLGNDLSDVHRLVGGKVDMEQDEFDYVKESFKLVDGWSSSLILARPLRDISPPNLFRCITRLVIVNRQFRCELTNICPTRNN